jgi:hypothetical protein
LWYGDQQPLCHTKGSARAAAGANPRHGALAQGVRGCGVWGAPPPSGAWRTPTRVDQAHMAAPGLTACGKRWQTHVQHQQLQAARCACCLVVLCAASQVPAVPAHALRRRPGARPPAAPAAKQRPTRGRVGHGVRPQTPACRCRARVCPRITQVQITELLPAACSRTSPAPSTLRHHSQLPARPPRVSTAPSPQRPRTEHAPPTQPPPCLEREPKVCRVRAPRAW